MAAMGLLRTALTAPEAALRQAMPAAAEGDAAPLGENSAVARFADMIALVEKLTGGRIEMLYPDPPPVPAPAEEAPDTAVAAADTAPGAGPTDGTGAAPTPTAVAPPVPEAGPTVAGDPPMAGNPTVVPAFAGGGTRPTGSPGAAADGAAFPGTDAAVEAAARTTPPGGTRGGGDPVFGRVRIWQQTGGGLATPVARGVETTADRVSTSFVLGTVGQATGQATTRAQRGEGAWVRSGTAPANRHRVDLTS
jgi:hypothetical protein